MLRRITAAAVAAVVLLAAWAGTAAPARADGSLWWLPTAWTSTLAGSLAAVRGALTGGTVGVAAQAGITQGAVSGDPGGNSHYYGYESVQVVVGTDGLLHWHTAVCNSPGGASSGCAGGQYYAGPADGALVTQSLIGTISCTGETRTSQTVSISAGVIAAPVFCNTTTKPLLTVTVAAVGGGHWSWTIQGFTWTSPAGADAFTTTVTCRSLSTGDDSTVTDTASGRAPSPVCPAGSAAVRVQVWQGSTLVDDSSITSSAWNSYQGYLTNPSGWQWIQDGSSSSNCHLGSKDDPTLIISMSVGICDEAGNNGQLGNDPSSSPDDGGIISWIVKAVAGIANVVSAVKSAVNGVVQGMAGVIADGISRVIGAISGVVKAITDAVGSIVKAIQDLGQLIQNGINSILSKLGWPLQPGGVGGCTISNPWNPVEWFYGPIACLFTPNTAVIGSKIDGVRDTLVGKIQPWQDAYQQMAGAFSMADQCTGWVLEMPAYIGKMSGVHQIEIGNSCSYPMSDWAAACRMATLALMVFGSVSAGFNFLMMGIGFTGPIGAAQGGVDAYVRASDAEAARNGVGERGLPASGGTRFMD